MDGLPASVTATVDAYLGRVDRHAPGLVTGLYLVGSIALGDYREGISDIDFVAVTSAEPHADRLDGLAQVHAELATLDLPAFDGVYVTPERLARIPGETEHASFSVEGRFRPDARCFEINPVVWACLARHGIALRGPETRRLDIATDPASLRRLQVDNLRTYWTGWIAEAERALSRKRPGESMAGASFSWGVLGVSRIARTAVTGDIVSKTEAGRWALATFATHWHPVIADALDARSGRLADTTPERFARGLAFMRFVIGWVDERG